MNHKHPSERAELARLLETVEDYLHDRGEYHTPVGQETAEVRAALVETGITEALS